MRTMTISLSPQQAERIEEAVRSGEYASNSEVLRDAFRVWERQKEMARLELARLQQAYEDGMASGAGVTVTKDEFLRGVKARKAKGG